MEHKPKLFSRFGDWFVLRYQRAELLDRASLEPARPVQLLVEARLLGRYMARRPQV